MNMPQKRFTVALSFPGEHRTFVEQVASALSSQIGKDRVLYDKYYEAEFARPNLDTHLQSLYHDESELIVVFLCEDYERKEWCGLEWRAIRDLIKKRRATSVMPFRFDMTEIPGLFSTDGYVWIDNRSPLEIAAVILKRLDANANTVAASLQTIEACEIAVHAVTASHPVQSTETSSHAPADYNPANRAFNVPFRPKGAQVIGRDDALQQVRDQLTQGRHTAIGHTAAFEGLGGLGKTQLAVEYAYRFNNCYPNGVIWINADQDINAQLTDIAVSARWIAPETEHRIKLDVALHRLRSFSDCLIIFDNVDDYTAIGPFLPLPTAMPHLLATSRTALKGFKAIHLNQLDEGQSLQLLFQEAGRQSVGDVEAEAAKNIVEQLDGLPLALELAGAYLCHRSTMSFVQYNDKLSSDPIKTLSISYLDSFTKHDADLFRTLKIDDDVVQEEPFLADILDILTWSGPAAMGLSLMGALLNKREPELSGALALGTQLKLLQKSAEEDRYSLHRLVREVRRHEQPLNGRSIWVDQVCSRLENWLEGVRQHFNQLPVFEGEIDHLVAWLNNVEHMNPLHACRLIWLQAYPAYHRAMYRESQRYILSAQDIFDRNKLTDSKLLAHLLNDLGAIFICLGQDLKARNCVERALAIRIESIGEHHPDTIMSYNNLGLVLDTLGYRQQALDNINKALKISSEYFGERYQDIARSYQNLSTVYWHLNDYENALKYAQKALDMCRKHLGELDPLTASSYCNLGAMYSNAGKNNDALIHLEKSLKIRYELFGENHPETARSFNSLGNASGATGDHRNALKYQEKALQIRLNTLGESHPDTLISYNNFSVCLQNLDKYQDALHVLSKGYALAKEALPNRHPLMELFEKGLRDVSEKLYRPGFRKPPIRYKKKKRK